MTSWRYVTNLFLLCVSLSRIHLSEEGCVQHLSLENISIHLLDTISLVQTKDLKDTMECTMEKKCRETGRDSIFCNILYDCFKVERRLRAENMCNRHQQTSRNVPFYHLICLVAEAVGLKSEDLEHAGCEYETACDLYPKATFYVIDQTTAWPSTTVTTKPTTTTTTTTTAAETTTAATSTEMSPTMTASTLSQQYATDTQSHDSTSQIKAPPESSQIMMVLIISGILHVVVPVAVYLYMRHKRNQDRRRWETVPEVMLHGVLSEAQQMTPVLPPECHCSLMPSASVRNGGTLGNGALD